MEIPDPPSWFASDTPDAMQGILIPKSLRFDTTPSKDQVELLDYAIKHVFVPPRLPSRADGNPQLESALLGLVRDCAASFKDHLQQGSYARSVWELIYTMLAASTKLHEGELTEGSVKTAITSMTPGGETALPTPLPHLLISLHRRCAPNLY